MSRRFGFLILFGLSVNLSGWQQPSTKPNFSGFWQLDQAKSKTDMKDLVWKIDHQSNDILIEELAGGKSVSHAKCSVGKLCEYNDSGKQMTAMTYFLDTTLVQMRSSSDNSSVIKRHLKMADDGSMTVELITIVPADKKDVLVFMKQKTGSAPVKAAAATDTTKP